MLIVSMTKLQFFSPGGFSLLNTEHLSLFQVNLNMDVDYLFIKEHKKIKNKIQYPNFMETEF